MFIYDGVYNENCTCIRDDSIKEKFKRKIAEYVRGKKINIYHIPNMFHVFENAICYDSYSVLADYDIIHLHWINNGIYSEKFMKYIETLNKPVVWTLHDMWPFTGGCHYTLGCEQYKQGCMNCSHLMKHDFPEQAIQKKIKYYTAIDIQFTGCSRWITEEFNRSFIGQQLTHKPAQYIPNPMPDKEFEVMDRTYCKSILKINAGKKMILFGASSATKDKRKGYEYFLQALRYLSKEEFCIGIFGNDENSIEIEGFEVYHFGMIKDFFHLAVIYGAADVFVAPSLQENLANTVMEALTCGIPVVAFDTGGMPDMIQNGINGYLAKLYDSQDLAEGIISAIRLEDKMTIHEELSAKFSPSEIAGRYVRLYSECMEENAKKQ